MRFNKFESAGLKPLGTGEQKNVYKDPNNEKRVISEIKNLEEKDTPRQLKGRYYLTKITHLLLPENIPDIHQAGESADGKQTADSENISHSPAHKELQRLRQAGEDTTLVKEQLAKELGGDINKLTMKLSDIGLGFNIDENYGNYTKDEKGNTHYIETFKPWEKDLTEPKELELLFDEELLREAIANLTEKETREKCTKLLDRLLDLVEEEKQELQKQEEETFDYAPSVEELNEILAPHLSEEKLAHLNSIKTQQEAKESKERENAKKALISFLEKLHALEEHKNVPSDVIASLREKRSKLLSAVGVIRGQGIVYHE